jgi:phosphopantothenoylcysteine decarboxylase/phosphopantothenate--cysteine ligase
MAHEVKRRAAAADAAILAAAVADFRPTTAPAAKLKKSDGLPRVELEYTEDILAALGRRKKRPFLVGFAAETERAVERARGKLVAKRADVIVANDVSRPDCGFETETNQVTLVHARGEEAWPLLSKDQVAWRLLDYVRDRLARKATRR